MLRGQRLQIMLCKNKPINLFQRASGKGKGKKRFGKGTLHLFLRNLENTKKHLEITYYFISLN